MGRVSVASNDRIKGPDGKDVEETIWLPVVAYGAAARFLSTHVHKGTPLHVRRNRICPWPSCGDAFMISGLLTRLRFVEFRQKRWELDEEIASHLDQAISVTTAAWVLPAEARRQALIDFGDITPTREKMRAAAAWWWIGTVVRDVHYAFRGFGRPFNPLSYVVDFRTPMI